MERLPRHIGVGVSRSPKGQLRDDQIVCVAHDLKTPLNAISLALTVVQAKLGERDRELVDVLGLIERNVAYMDRLVHDVLDLSAVEHVGLELHREPVDLVSLLTSVRGRVFAHQPRVQFEAELTGSGVVLIDRSRIERVVVNLIENALKYSPPSSRILVRVDYPPDRVCVSVIDTGDGLAQSEMAKIFGKHRRGTNGKRRDGAGLGLYLSRSIIEAHGGTIDVVGVAGGGSRFFFELPVCPPDRDREPGVMQRRTSLDGARVLFVNDEIEQLLPFVDLLRVEGIVPTLATSNIEALADVDDDPPDIVVIDAEMQHGAGLTLLAQLRERRPALPVVLIVGTSPRHPLLEACRGAVLEKPLDISRLSQLLVQSLTT